MATRLRLYVHKHVERAFPEQRIFLRSETDTKFIRLTPMTQAMAWTGSALFVGWAIIATATIVASAA